MTTEASEVVGSNKPPQSQQRRSSFDDSWLTSETSGNGITTTVQNGHGQHSNNDSASDIQQPKRVAPTSLRPSSTYAVDSPISFSDVTIHPPLLTREGSATDQSPDMPAGINSMSATPPMKKKPSGIKGFFKSAFSHSSSSNSIMTSSNSSTSSLVIPGTINTPSLSKRRPSTQSTGSIGSSNNGSDMASKFFIDPEHDGGGAPMIRGASKVSVDGDKSRAKKSGGIVAGNVGKWWARHDGSTSEGIFAIFGFDFLSSPIIYHHKQYRSSCVGGKACTIIHKP